MLTPVKAYLAGIIILGSLSLGISLQGWDCADPGRFAVYLGLALVAGALKVRLPGLAGTFSLTFLLVLIGIAQLSRGETVVLACLSMVVQSVWNTAVRTTSVQVLFNVATVAISVGLAFPVARGLSGNNIVQLLTAAAIYYMINTLLVSGILSFVERKPLFEVWAQWFRWSSRYYLAGVATALVILVSSQFFGWMFSLVILPVMYIEYLCLRLTAADKHGFR